MDYTCLAPTPMGRVTTEMATSSQEIGRELRRLTDLTLAEKNLLSDDRRRNTQHGIKPLNFYRRSIEVQIGNWCSTQLKIKPN